MYSTIKNYELGISYHVVVYFALFFYQFVIFVEVLIAHRQVQRADHRIVKVAHLPNVLLIKRMK